jgi:CxxC-x17-CxxC domain-containing protein
MLNEFEHCMNNSGGVQMDKRDFKGPRVKYNTKCSGCGQQTDVPFIPDPNRPVYCKECFPKHKPAKKE